MDLTTNLLFGKIPSSIGNLSQLFKLNLSSNKLEGGIPIEIANCKNLQHLDISNNSLSGIVPKELFSLLSSLVIVNLFRNSFSGSLPVEVGKLNSVYSLDLSENNLTGNVQSAIGDCESLELLTYKEISLMEPCLILCLLWKVFATWIFLETDWPEKFRRTYKIFLPCRTWIFHSMISMEKYQPKVSFWTQVQYLWLEILRFVAVSRNCCFQGALLKNPNKEILIISN